MLLFPHWPYIKSTLLMKLLMGRSFWYWHRVNLYLMALQAVLCAHVQKRVHVRSGNYRVAPPNVDNLQMQSRKLAFHLCVLFMIKLRSTKRQFSGVRVAGVELGVILPAAGRCRPTGAVSRVMLLVRDRENSGTLSRITRRTACCHTASWNKKKGVSERHPL